MSVSPPNRRAQTDAGTPPGTPVAALTGNVGGATVKGIELEGEWLATPHLTISYGVNVHSAKYANGATGQDIVAAEVCDGVVCSETNPSIAGKTISRQANNQADAGIQYADHFAGDYGWYVRADADYKGKQYAGEEDLSWVDSRTLVNMRAGISHDLWSLEAWVKNLGDLHYVSSVFTEIGTHGAGSTLYTLHAIPGRPSHLWRDFERALLINSRRIRASPVSAFTCVRYD